MRFHQAGIRARRVRGRTRAADDRDHGSASNLVIDPTVDGILVEATAADTLLERNLVLRSGDDGIDVESPDTTLTRNLALRNGDLGIEAVRGGRRRRKQADGERQPAAVHERRLLKPRGSPLGPPPGAPGTDAAERVI